MSLTLLGSVAVALAGVVNGSFAVPAKRNSIWMWQHIWLIYILTAYCALPLLVTAFTAPAVFGLLAAHPLITVRVALLGACFGVGVLCFGFSLDRLGISATNALVNGIAVLFGSVGPALLKDVRLERSSWLLLLGGLALTVAGIAACSAASMLRDLKTWDAVQTKPSLSGLGFALLSGILGAILNIAFVQDAPLVRAAENIGMGYFTRTMVAWVPILLGGFLVNVTFSGYQITRARGWSTYWTHGVYPWGQSILMGLLWFVALAVYGTGALLMNTAGPVFGWVMYVGASILTSTLWGAFLGEWNGAPPRAKRLLYTGSAFLLTALAGLAALGILA